MLLVATFLAAVGLASLVLGKFESAQQPALGARAGVAAMVDALPPPLQMALSYAVPVAFLALAVGAARRVIGGRPGLTLTGEGATTYSLFGSKTIAWTDVRSASLNGDLVGLNGSPESVVIALNVIADPRAEILGLVRVALAARNISV